MKRGSILMALAAAAAILIGTSNAAYAQAGGVPDALGDLTTALTTAVSDLKSLFTSLQNSVNAISAPELKGDFV